MMDFNQDDFIDLARRAASLTVEAADVPRFLKLRFGPEHELAKSADQMLAMLETFVRELRSFQNVPGNSQTQARDT